MRDAPAKSKPEKKGSDSKRPARAVASVTSSSHAGGRPKDRNLERTAGVSAMTIKPRSGPTTGRTPVEISGGPWDEQTIMFTTVMFDGDAATNIDLGAEESTSGGYKTYKSIIATTPPHSAGTVNVSVTTPDNCMMIQEGAFTFVFDVSAVEPSKGKVSTEEDIFVIITGNDLADVRTVKFGEKSATFGLIDAHHIWARVPYSDSPGEVAVKVTTLRGENADKKFEYTT
jgi:hypothetical protein